MSGGLLDVWPPLPPTAWFRRRPAQLPWPLEEPACTLVARARHGLYRGLLALGLRTGDEVLMPAYHHGSEVEATIRAGLECRFYAGNAELEPDEGELEQSLGPHTRALHLTHYLGFPQNAARWRAWCDERNLLLVEDAAQAWLADDVGTAGDLVVFCLYKTFGIPDGAALVARGIEVEPRGGFGLGALVRRQAAWVAGRSGALTALMVARPRQRPYVAAEDFALGEVEGPARASRRLIPRLAATDAAAARRGAYARLLEALGEHVPAPFDRLPPGASPFALPVETEHKAEVLSSLAQERIRALDLWSVPHPSLPVDRFPAAARRRACTVGLPVHQELRDADLERIAHAAAASLSSVASRHRGRPRGRRARR